MKNACIPEIPQVDNREADIMLNDESFIWMLVGQWVQRCRNTADCATQATFLGWNTATKLWQEWLVDENIALSTKSRQHLMQHLHFWQQEQLITVNYRSLLYDQIPTNFKNSFHFTIYNMCVYLIKFIHFYFTCPHTHIKLNPFLQKLPTESN